MPVPVLITLCPSLQPLVQDTLALFLSWEVTAVSSLQAALRFCHPTKRQCLLSLPASRVLSHLRASLGAQVKGQSQISSRASVEVSREKAQESQETPGRCEAGQSIATEPPMGHTMCSCKVKTGMFLTDSHRQGPTKPAVHILGHSPSFVCIAPDMFCQGPLKLTLRMW